ncbi:MAG: NAD(P)-binding protein [Eubacteriales bacterium]|nr:NAD(P)-binding protein [Eubacteriales bacterium]
MSRLTIKTVSQAQTTVEGLYKDVERRIIASPPGLCPVDLAASFLKLCHAQTCGKCVPCRVGLGQLEQLMDDVLDGSADESTVDLIEQTARVIKNTADCAIGFEAASMVLKGVEGFRDDYLEHVRHNRCIASMNQPIPCTALCPAGVDIPGYVALIHEGRYSDAVRLIRKDNPFPVVCGMICEHPCENRCRRGLIDASINIRGLKRYACDNAGRVPVPECAEPTGRKVAVIGGGPGGLSCAYYLSLMGHSVTVYDAHKYLGGMLRYGIPSYRLPREELQRDIDAILSTGIRVEKNTTIGKDLTIDQLGEEFDAVFIAIGAQQDKKLNLPGENGRGVFSAVELLGRIGDGDIPDFTGKNVCIIGGGNTAMDCTRSSKRMGASRVTCVYRRRTEDMTALPDEIEGAVEEGCEIMTMSAPVRIELDDGDNVTGLVVQPQIPGAIDKSGRPRPVKADLPEVIIPCDIVIVAIGQGVDSKEFEEAGIPVVRGSISAFDTGNIADHEGIFAGGDCVSGPATAIRAIGAGKVAAANIDQYLGFNHEITSGVEIPHPVMHDCGAYGRIQPDMRPAGERSRDFEQIELCMTDEEACQESGRCLRCDHFGCGVLKGGREERW